MKSYGVTIQIKATEQYCLLILFGPSGVCCDNPAKVFSAVISYDMP